MVAGKFGSITIAAMVSEGHGFIGKRDPSLLDWFIKDSILTAGSVIALIASDDAATLATFDDLVAKSKRRRENVFGIALEEKTPISTPVAALFAANLLHAWIGTGSFNGPADNFLLLESLWEETEPNPTTPNARIMRHLFDALGAMVRIDPPKKQQSSPQQSAFGSDIQWTGANFLKLADLLARLGHADPALKCAQSAHHFLNYDGGAAAALPAAQLALRMARKTGSLIGGELARIAHTLASLAETNPAMRIQAFDAVETALRFQVLTGQTPQNFIELVANWTQQAGYLRLLQPLAWLALPPDKRWQIPPESAERASWLAPIWEVKAAERGGRILVVGRWAIEMENARLALQPGSTDMVATSSWATWRFTHSFLMRAIPQSQSLLREEQCENILLLLRHETTHVFSMMGPVGKAAWAMRWALYNLELYLWFSRQKTHDDTVAEEIVERAQPMPLSERDPKGLVADLGRVEQELELERKIQLLERIWSPFFEGLAVFGELSADPVDDKDAYDPVVGVINNLVDESAVNEREERGGTPEEAWRRLWDKAETLLHNAQLNKGIDRLTDYLKNQPQKYLAGYLAIRAVAAAWRAKMKKPLTGAHIFKMMLHATRFSGSDLVPNPALPLEEFSAAALASQIKWLQSLCEVPADELDQLNKSYIGLSGHEGGFLWKNGRIVHVLPAQFEETELTGVTDLINCYKLAMQTLSGQYANPARVPAADEMCGNIMPMMADILKDVPEKLSPLLNIDIAKKLLAGRIVMPIGKVECPFWLSRDSCTLICLIRTREKDKDTGKPSYNIIEIPLSPEEFAAVEERMRKGAPARLNLNRVSLLIPPVGDSQVVGLNFLVFQLDDWMKIMPAGKIFGTDEVSKGTEWAIQNRLQPSFMVSAMEILTGDDHPCAQRSAQWLKAQNWNQVFNDIPADLNPWADRASLLAEQILTKKESDDTAPARLALLEFVLGKIEGASQLAQKGFNFLPPAGLPKVLALIEILHASGRSPIADPNNKIRDLDSWLRDRGLPILELTAHGWDVVRPAAS